MRICGASHEEHIGDADMTDWYYVQEKMRNRGNISRDYRYKMCISNYAAQHAHAHPLLERYHEHMHRSLVPCIVDRSGSTERAWRSTEREEWFSFGDGPQLPATFLDLGAEGTEYWYNPLVLRIPINRLAHISISDHDINT